MLLRVGNSKIALLTSKIAPDFNNCYNRPYKGQNRPLGGDIAPVEEPCLRAFLVSEAVSKLFCRKKKLEKNVEIMVPLPFQIFVYATAPRIS